MKRILKFLKRIFGKQWSPEKMPILESPEYAVIHPSIIRENGRVYVDVRKLSNRVNLRAIDLLPKSTNLLSAKGRAFDELTKQIEEGKAFL